METARQVADRLTEALERGDPQGVAALYRDDAVLIEPVGTFRGREQIEEYWTAFFDAFSDLRPGVRAKFQAGDTAMDEWSFSATHSGTLETPSVTVAPTGRRVTVRGADAGVVRDGAIAEHRIYYDLLDLLEQVGAVPVSA
jgi:uncharacterized protein (TIGR02246 family)